MAQISVSLPADGETIDASDYNTPINTIINDYNDNIDNSNIAANAAIAASKIADGGITNAKLSTTAGESGGAWASWTPSYTNFTAGNGTLTYAKYTQIGKTVHFRFKFVWGSTTSASGTITISLPVTAHAEEVTSTSNNFIGVGNALDSGTNQFSIFPYVVSSTTFAMQAQAASGAYTTPTLVNATVPFTFTTNDAIVVRGSYEIA